MRTSILTIWRLVLALGLLTSSTAYAVVDIDAGNNPHVHIPDSAGTKTLSDSSDTITDGTGSSSDDTVSGNLDIRGAFTSIVIPKNLSVRISFELTGGATFNATPVMGDLWDGNSSVAFNLIQGGTGSTSAVFRPENNQDGFKASFFALDVRGLKLTSFDPVDVIVNISYADSFGETQVRSTRAPYLRFGDNTARNVDQVFSPLVYAAESDLTVTSKITDTNDSITDNTAKKIDDAVTGVMDLTGDLATGAIAAKTDVFVTVSLSDGAKFDDAPQVADIWDGNSSQAAVLTTGGAGSTQSVFKIASGDGFTDSASLSINVRGVEITAKKDIEMTVLVQTGTGSSAVTLRELTFPYISFRNALDVSISAEDSPDRIDSAQGSLFFDGGTADADVSVGSITVAARDYLNMTGSWKLSSNNIIDAFTLSLDAPGGLAAFNQSGGSVSFGEQTATVSGTTATSSAFAPFASTSAVVLTVPSGNSTKITESAVTASILPTMRSGFVSDTLVASGKLASIALADADSDGVSDTADNCVNNRNATQLDTDGDGKGDACDSDLDGDGVANTADNCINVANADQAPSGTVSGRGAACDTDSDGDSVFDPEDAFPQDATEWADSDGDGKGDNSDSDLKSTGRVYLMTTSTSNNFTRLHVVNSTEFPQRYTGTLYNQDGDQLGAAGVALHSGTVASQGRLILTSAELENLFGTMPWVGPAVLEVSSGGGFELMTKLTSPSGLISNTNCVRQGLVHNVDGFNVDDRTFVRLINTRDTVITDIYGQLVSASGAPVGKGIVRLAGRLEARSAIWLNRDDLSSMYGAQWDGAATLSILDPDPDLRLLNLNFVNNETFFNFSCFENQDSAGVYLMTNSASMNISETHLVNTSNEASAFTATVYSEDGTALGTADSTISTSNVIPGGRLVIDAMGLESKVGTTAWSGPAVVRVKGPASFELMTRLTSPSGLVSNTNCVRQGNVQNIEGADSANVTFVRFINDGSTTITDLRGTLYDKDGKAIGAADTQLLTELKPNAAAWLSRSDLASKFASWDGEATLDVDADHLPGLKLINLNRVNGETFFNFSCYEKGHSDG